MAVCLSLASPKGENAVTLSMQSSSNCRTRKEVRVYDDLHFSPLRVKFQVALLINLLGVLNLKSEEKA